uniref:Oxidoreductase FAD/NAD(P)-binding domain protein n=1 Tax=Cyanothece sp. (strain PCC 7425 / ATCC 29141) TaxID=395961 RepID=B8HJR2_CYAP4
MQVRETLEENSLGAALPLAVEPMLPKIYRVSKVRKETPDIFTLELAGEPLVFAPGQFNMLYAFGVGESAISISGNPQEPDKLVHSIRSVGTVTHALSRLRPGDALGIRGPFGRAWPLATAQGSDVIFIAGGIGLAPLRPAIYQVLADRAKYGQVVLLYGTRTPEDIAFQRNLRQWRSRLDTEVWVTVSSAATGWQGNVGVVTSLIQRASFDPLHTIALICGPEIMMKFAIQELLKQGVNPANIYITLERNMKCAIGFCGHCQLGPAFICKDGPVFRYDQIKFWFEQRQF